MGAHLRTTLAGLNGIGSRRELLRAGVRPEDVKAAWSAGDVVRVRNGTYALPELPEQVKRAKRVGGVLAGPSAATILGLWDPPDQPLHVSVGRGDKGFRDPDDAGVQLGRGRTDVRILFDAHRLREWERAHVGIRNCLRQSVGLLEPPLGLAMIDSALRAGVLSTEQVEVLRGDLPRRCHRAVDLADARRESGTESVMVWLLVTEQIEFRVQTSFTRGAHRVDFELPRRIIVECVSKKYHASPEQYARDRHRISALVRQGYIVLEFTYAQVMYDRATVIETIRAALAFDGDAGEWVAADRVRRRV